MPDRQAILSHSGPDVPSGALLEDASSSATGLRANCPGRDDYSPGPVLHRLGGPTCLAGDVIGDYVFSRPLLPGDVLVFDDMAHYTMVKTTTFNGVKHPPIALLHEDGRIEIIREFTFADFPDRLA